MELDLLILPDLGEGLTEAEIVDWHVAPGDRVVAEQPLVSVETEKAVVEIPSPESGVIAELYAKPGDRVPVGKPLLRFDSGSRRDEGSVVGDLEDETPATESEKPFDSESTTQPLPGVRIKASPSARKLAQQHAIDMTRVTATGPGGSITREDVNKLISADEASTGEPLRGVRLAMARAMTRSGREVVPATVTDQARLDWWDESIDITTRLVRAIVTACSAEPALNAWYEAESERRTLHESVSLGLAVDTADGLFVPVLRDIDGCDDETLRKRIDELVASVENRSISRTDMLGQTITLSNFGMIGGLFANLVITPPQVAILGAGRLHQSVLPGVAGPEVAAILPLSLTFDHRVVSGSEAARFMNTIVNELSRDHPY